MSQIESLKRENAKLIRELELSRATVNNLLKLNERASSQTDTARRKTENLQAALTARANDMLRLRSVLTEVCAAIEDEGDRVFFGSTNHADELKQAFGDLEDWAWEDIMNDGQLLDVYEASRKANARADAAEAKVKELTEKLQRREMPSAWQTQINVIRNQLKINVEIAERDHPEGEIVGGKRLNVLPHSQAILAGHILEHLTELETMLSDTAVGRVLRKLRIERDDAYRSLTDAERKLAEYATQSVVPEDKWEIDRSTGTDILVFDKCSVIENENAHFVLGLIRGHNLKD